MNTFILNTKNFIFRKQKDILSSTLIISSMIFASMIFGFIRYRTLATYFTTAELDIFLAAFRIPDLIFDILITGALSSAFIPIFIRHKNNSEELRDTMSTIINILLLTAGALCIIMFLLADWLMPLITPGFSPETILRITALSKLLLVLQLPFFILGGILSGIGQANKIFFASAIAPVLYNIGIIFGTILLAPTLGITGAIGGVIIGALLLFLVQLPIPFITHFQYRFFILKRKILHEFFFLYTPRILSIIANQIDLTIDLTLSSLAGAGSYTVFYFAQHIQWFPVAFVGMAFAQAALPYLSELYHEKKYEELKNLFVESLLQLFYLAIPLSLLLIFARTPIVRLIVGGKKLDWEATNLIALTLSFFAIAIPIHTVFYFITRAFYALHDTKTPFIINVVSIFVNVGLSTYLVVLNHYPVWSLAIAFSFSITVNVVVSLLFFYRKIGGFNKSKFFTHIFKMYVAAFCAAIPSYIVMKLFDALIINNTRTLSLVALLGLTSLMYFGCFIFFSWLFNIEEIYIWGRLTLTIREMKRKISEVYVGKES